MWHHAYINTFCNSKWSLRSHAIIRPCYVIRRIMHVIEMVTCTERIKLGSSKQGTMLWKHHCRHHLQQTLSERRSNMVLKLLCWCWHERTLWEMIHDSAVIACDSNVLLSWTIMSNGSTTVYGIVVCKFWLWLLTRPRFTYDSGHDHSTHEYFWCGWINYSVTGQ